MTILGFGTPQLKENPREKYEYAEKKKQKEREMDISERQATIKLTKYPSTPLFSFWPCQTYVSSSSLAQIQHSQMLFSCSLLQRKEQ